MAEVKTSIKNFFVFTSSSPNPKMARNVTADFGGILTRGREDGVHDLQLL
jgi:hypothetical protein